MARRVAAISVAAIATVGLVSASAAARLASHQTTLSIVRVTSAPDGRGPLSRRHLNIVTVHPTLSFKVVVRNETTRRQVRVTLSITRRPASYGPIVRTKTVALTPNQTASLVFGRLGPIAFAQRETLKIAVADPRTREVWVTTYPVIFALG